MSEVANTPSVFLSDPDVTLWHGDVLETLHELPAESADCVVTSPPYWGLRDYGQEGQLGLEPTPEQYVERMVEVFREVRRVLAAHGTVWLNLGDSYATAPHGNKGDRYLADGGAFRADKPFDTAKASGLKPKDLVGIPWRVAFALQADGWYLRSDIIWAKPNPMPESVTDRPTKAHEYLFLLSKQPRYFFDAEAVREPFEARPQQRLTPTIAQPLGPARVAAGVQQGNVQGGTHVNRFAVQSETLIGVCGCHDAGCGRSFHADDCGCACHEGEKRGPDGRRNTHVEAANGSIQHRDGERWPNGGRNIRSVWEIATQPYPEAHFATFPEELARRAIAAGCRESGTVLDPFVGSGTTCYVARKLGRHSIGIDLNAEYLALAARRLQQQSLFAETAA